MNEAITGLLSIAMLILWLAALLGLLVPRWVFQPTRLRGFFVPLALSVLALIGLGMVVPQPTADDPAAGTPPQPAAEPATTAPAPPEPEPDPEPDEPTTDTRSACAMDLECWTRRHRVAGTVACRAAVEAQALYAFEWQSGILRPRFPEVRWWDEDQGTLLFLGNAIRFQNAFGGWIDHNYACAYDPETDTVLDAGAAPRSSL